MIASLRRRLRQFRPSRVVEIWGLSLLQAGAGAVWLDASHSGNFFGLALGGLALLTGVWWISYMVTDAEENGRRAGRDAEAARWRARRNRDEQRGAAVSRVWTDGALADDAEGGAHDPRPRAD